MFYVHEADVVHIHHFLEECSLCAKSLSGDIFMYRSPPPRNTRTYIISVPLPFFLFSFTRICIDGWTRARIREA
jgi:hypothetical protein